MKFRTLKKWKNIDDCELLLYSAQLLEELLFDYSLDTYKPSAMNTSLLCQEALMAIEDIERGVIDKANLAHIVEELSLNLRKDLVAKSILTIDVNTCQSILSNKHEKISEKKIVLELIYSEIGLIKYRKKNEDLLLNALKNNAGKNEVRALIRSYVTTLKNVGYSSNFLNSETLDYFYYGKNEISSNGDMEGFIERFKRNDEKYVAIYRASKIFKTITDSCESIGIDVTDDPKEYKNHLNGMGFRLRNNDETFVVIKDIEALDPHSARESSEQRIETMGTLLTLFHHKEHPSWKKECVVINLHNDHSRKVNAPINPMHRCIDLKAEKASKKLNRMINEFSLHESSFTKFARSAELHSLALNSDSKENQMINLWIALESLVPPSSKDKPRIASIIDGVMPFVNLAYPNRILERFIADIYNWRPGVLNSAVKGIGGGRLQNKVVKLLTQPEYEKKKNEIFASFGNFYLLRNRAFHIGKLFESGASVYKMLEAHDERVKWQIRRIYRTRNLIVHSGVTPSFTSILIENIHDYLDVIMSTLVNIASDGVDVNSIEQGFKYIDINYQSYLRSIKENDGKFSSEEIDDLLFGKTI